MNVKYTKEILQEAASRSTSWAGMCRALGVRVAGGSQRNIQNRSAFFGVDTSHFTGQTWNRGRATGPRKSIDVYFSNEARIHSPKLKARLIKEGFKEAACEDCGLSGWRGEEAPLELDHVDGNHFNNALENLKILCSNCHTVKTKKQLASVIQGQR